MDLHQQDLWWLYTKIVIAIISNRMKRPPSFRTKPFSPSDADGWMCYGGIHIHHKVCSEAKINNFVAEHFALRASSALAVTFR